jgi:two-component system, NtrC family, sensor histidine kinase HydH
LIYMSFFQRITNTNKLSEPFAQNAVGAMPQPEPLARQTRFALSQWFGLVAFSVIAAIATVSVWLLSWFITQRMLWQEGVLTRDFVHSLMLVEKPMQSYLRAQSSTIPPEVEASFEHIATMPNMVRANVYNLDRKVIWSSDPELKDRSFGANPELDLTLTGAVVVEQKRSSDRLHGKTEHASLRSDEVLFVEIYVPVVDVESNRIIGAIEFYKNPRELMRVLEQLRNYIALGAGVFGLLLFAALFWLVRRADRTMQCQERQLVEKETFAVVGEMSSVVAHGIRNPLATIRSSAELILQSPGQGVAEAANDIVAQTDRLGAWVRELLAYTMPTDMASQPVALAPLVHTCLQEFARDCERRHITTSAQLPDDMPAVRGDFLAIGQVLRTLLANAIDAVPTGGRIAVRAVADATTGSVKLTVQDNGTGIPPAQRARVGKPFFTTKPKGMGVGLALARRVLERAGGSLQIDSEPHHGTQVTIVLLNASVGRSRP